MLGRSLGRYRLERVLGRGGMGSVYLGVAETSGARVAVKVLAEECARDTQLVERFVVEARAANMVRHESLARVLDFATLDDGRPYIVMEYVDGPTLRKIAAGGAAPLGGIARVIGEVLRALAATHAAGVIHRDLKPDNVLVTEEGHAKVLDFGIAKLAARHGPLPRTQTGVVLGTPEYMAPEQISDGPVDARADLYAVGVMLYEAITGRRPFDATSDYEVMRAHLDEPVRPPRAIRADLTPELEAVVMRALAKHPSDRFASAGEMADALARAAARLPADQQRELSARARPLPPQAAPSRPPPADVAPPPSVATVAERPRARAPSEAPTVARVATAPVVPPRRRLAPYLAAGAALIAVAVVATVIVRRRHADAPPSPAPGEVYGAGTVFSENVDFDPSSFDPIAFLPRARLSARRMLADAELVGFTMDGVSPTGRVMLAVGGIQEYRFRSPERSRAAVGACLVLVTVHADEVYTRLTDGACDEELVDPPSCTLVEVWDRAATTLGRSAWATLRWESGERWSFRARIAAGGTGRAARSPTTVADAHVVHPRAMVNTGAAKPKTAITPTRADNYQEWYQQVVAGADLAENSDVRGCMVIKPWGYALWENIQRALDDMFKATGHVNAYFPLFIPVSFLEKEAAHVEGFAKECAVVTHHRLELVNGKLVPAGKLEEPLIVRPTSETIIGASFAKWVKSYRDLPLLINQWANVVRWEMRTRLFLRTAEFLWQEGHTAHATSDEAVEETMKMLGVYAEFAEQWMAMPVIPGEKTAGERFPGAVQTYSIEAMMQDRKALQAGTSHFLGQNFAKASDIKFLDHKNVLGHAWTTSWGVSTRLVGGMIMTHADDDGMVCPPRLAPKHVVILPIARKPEDRVKVLESANALAAELRAQTYAGAPVRVELDDRDVQGKRWQWVKKGVPLRIEIGLRDIEAGTVSLERRDQGTSDKAPIARGELVARVGAILGEIQDTLHARAKAYRTEHTRDLDTKEDFYAYFAEPAKKDANDPTPIHGGFAMAHFNGDPALEAKIKEDLKVTVRCVPLAPGEPGVCPFTGQPSAKRVVWAKSY